MFDINLEDVLSLIKSKEEADTVVTLYIVLVQLRSFVKGHEAMTKHENVGTRIVNDF